MSGHTPGPWTTVRNNHMEPSLINKGRGLRIVWSESLGRDLAYITPADDDNGNANARLIAAAPDLLVALKSAGEWVAAVDPKLPMPGKGDTQMYVLEVIQAAIAKAEGRS